MLYILAVLISFALAWVLRPKYEKWARIRRFNWLASSVYTFEEGISRITLFLDQGPSHEHLHEFKVAFFPKLVELATTQEDMEELQSNDKWMSVYYSLGSHHPACRMFIQKGLKKSELPHRSRPRVIPMTRVV